MSAYRLGLYEKALPDRMTLPEKLAASCAAGFDYLEISIDETDAKLARLDWTRSERRALARAMGETGQPVCSMCLSGHRRYPLGSADPALAARSLDISQKAVRLAADLGVRVIQLAGYDVYYEPSTRDTRARFLENLQKTVDYAAAYGVMLGFETMETPFMNSCAKAMRYVNHIKSPYLNVYPDVGNIKNAVGDRYLEDYETAAGHIVAAHLKETVPGKFREIPFGDGHVDFPGSIRKLCDLGVSMFVGEFWYTANETAAPPAYIAAAHGFLRRAFDAARGLGLQAAQMQK